VATFVVSSWSNTNTNDYFGTGDGRDSLIITAPAGLQAGDICVSFLMSDAAVASGGGVGPKKANGTTPTGLTSIGSGYAVTAFISHTVVAAHVLGSDIPDLWQGFYGDPAVLTNKKMIGGVMVFRDFTWNAVASAPTNNGTLVGPTTGDVTPLVDLGTVTPEDYIDVTLWWSRWSTTDTDLPRSAGPSVFTFDDEIFAGTTSTGRRGLYGAYTFLVNGEDSPADSVTLDQTDQTSIRARAVQYLVGGTHDVAAAAAAGVTVPETKLNLKVLPNKVYAASLDGWAQRMTTSRHSKKLEA
jgi:hypothetical protein